VCMKPGNSSPTIEMISAVIAHSQIVVARHRPMPRLPAGYDHADIAVLEWIAVEGGRLGHRLLPM
jgi:hypothetical protein